MSSTTIETSNEIPKMEYVRFGTTGMRVSKVCFGAMSVGTSEWFPWVKDEEESIEIIKQSIDAGINFFDTANTYSNGRSEIVLGKALKKIGVPRGRVVIATKVYSAVHDDVSKYIPASALSEDPLMVNGYGLSRKHIFDSVEASLKRLDVDYIDLLQIHRLDRNTPMEEIMEALNDLVRSGKVRYIGASSMAAWEFQKLNAIAERKGWTTFVSQQNLYNLIYREEEREMIPYCLDTGVAGMPWSPLAMGELTGKNRKTARETSGLTLTNIFPGLQQTSNDTIIDRIEEIAQKRNVTNAQIAMAWLYSKKYVTSPIVGFSKIEQLYDIMKSFKIKLTEEEIKYLEEPYTPRAVTGYE